MDVEVLTAVHAAHAGFLGRAWESLRGQTNRDWTWLVQVDGPGGAVLDALAACGAREDPRVRIDVHGEQLGPAVARNCALGRSTAPLIQNLDADDELEPSALEVLSGALAADPAAGFAVGQARDLHEDGSLAVHRLPVEAGPLPRNGLFDHWLADTDRVPVHPAGVLWRRSLLLRMGGWAGLRGREDTGLLMAASAACPGVVVADFTLRYRKHPGQLSETTGKFGGAAAQLRFIRERAEVLGDIAPSGYSV
ncbi:glycosyltransferase family 2 protein [Amycolatopsis magusensis]|uniref:glycosyltransferase family 2 protein n=1 Tax=Amycolatopsis magusensis TaxID=882444 RepID=UPI003C2B9D88